MTKKIATFDSSAFDKVRVNHFQLFNTSTGKKIAEGELDMEFKAGDKIKIPGHAFGLK